MIIEANANKQLAVNQQSARLEVVRHFQQNVDQFLLEAGSRMLAKNSLYFLQLGVQHVSLLDDPIDTVHQLPVPLHPVLQVRFQVLYEFSVLV